MGDVYADRGYGAAPVGFGEKPGVVAVDLQRGFTDAAFPMGGAPMVGRAVENTARVMRAAKAAGAPVVACVVALDGPKAAPRWKVPPVFDLLAGTPPAALDPRIAAEEPDVVLAKAAPSILFGTPAVAILDAGAGGRGDGHRLHHLRLRARERRRRLLARLPRAGA